MNICVVSYNHPPYIGGIETYSKNLKKYLHNDKFILNFVTGNLYKYKLIRILEVILRFFLTLITKKYQIIHITSLNLWPVLLSSKLLKNKPKYIVNLHGLDLVYGNRKKFLSKLYEFLIPYKFINNQNNIYFICNSNQTLDLASKKFNKKNLRYIPMGVESVDSSYQQIESIKNQFFYVGRILHRKGLSWFCENILSEFHNYQLLFAGPIIDTDEFEKVSLHPQTKYLGKISETEKAKLYKSSLLTIIPNLIDTDQIDFEGFGISFLEVSANGGIPLVTKTQGFITSSLDGKMQITIDNNNPDEWIRNIKNVQSHNLRERKEIIFKNQKLIEENFLWEKVFEQTVNFYEEILN